MNVSLKNREFVNEDHLNTRGIRSTLGQLSKKMEESRQLDTQQYYTILLWFYNRVPFGLLNFEAVILWNGVKQRRHWQECY